MPKNKHYGIQLYINLGYGVFFERHWYQTAEQDPITLQLRWSGEEEGDIRWGNGFVLGTGICLPFRFWEANLFIAPYAEIVRLPEMKYFATKGSSHPIVFSTGLKIDYFFNSEGLLESWIGP